MQIVPLIGRRRPSPLHQLAGLVLALLGIALATLVGQVIASHSGSDAVVMLYLLPVLAAAIFGGIWPAFLIAIAASLAYNFFFTEPVHTLFVRSSASLVTIVVLFVVGTVTSTLAGSLREHALLAATHAARNATIAGFARRLLSCGEEADIGAAAVREIGSLFHCHATILEGDEAPAIVAAYPRHDALSPADLAIAAQTIASGVPAGRGITRAPHLADWQFHPIGLSSLPGAALGLARDDGFPPVSSEQGLLLDSLLDQVALAIGRARSDREARDLAALRQRDGMRDALLSSVGRDIKPSINAIATAGRALRRSGDGDRSLVAAVLSEAAKLLRYVDNLSDLLPDAIQEPVVSGDVVIDLYRRAVTKAGQPVALTPKEYALLTELAKHAGRVLTHGQLLRSVWGAAQEHQVEYLRVAIGGLRRKLEDSPSEPVLIVNEPATGYRLVVS